MCVCVLSVSSVIFCPKCWLTGHRGHQTFLMLHHRSIRAHFLSGDIFLSVSPSGPLKGECMFTTVGNGTEMDRQKKKKKRYPFKKAFWISSLVGISASCYATSAGVQNIHKDLVASQTGNLPHEAMWAALSSVRHSDGDWEDDWVMPTGSRWKQTGDVRKRGGWKRTGEKINRQSVWQKRLGVGG